MRKKLNSSLAWFLVLLAFPLVVFVDAKARTYSGGSMQIDGLPLENATVTGTWHPDFLWSGKAWQIEIETDQPLQLNLDDRNYVIPKGSHKLYSNHDHTNTGEFGPRAFWGYPETVEIRLLNEKP